MVEYQVIRLFTRSKQQWERYSGRVDNLTLEKEIKDLLHLITTYYQTYPEHSFISKDELIGHFDYHYPSHKNRATYLDIIERIYHLDTSDSLASAILKRIIEKDTWNRLINKGLPIVSGEYVPDTIGEASSILEEHNRLIETEEEGESPFFDASLEELIQTTTVGGLKWGLQCIQEDLGDLPGNTLGHFNAVPDAGKTSFVHFQVANWCTQLEGEQTCLWFNNEEGKEKIKLRFYSAVCNATRDQLMAAPAKAKEIFTQRNGHRMLLRDNDIITMEEIERLCIDHKARIAVVDIGDKIMYKGRSKAGNGADALQGVYDNLRQVVKRINKHHKCDIFTTGQAGTTAENKQWLQQSDLYGGKTGKAGAFDYIIGMGHLLERPEQRFLSFCKNKLGTQSRRHVVNFNPLTARFFE